MLTDAEAADLEKQIAQQRVKSDTFGSLESGSYNQFWYDSGTRVLSTRQTSLVVDPPDGRVPVRPSAEARRDHDAAHNSDSYEFMSPWDRCITRGVPGSMFPAGYNNAYQIVQTPGYVAIAHEMIHDVRIIPIDSSASNLHTVVGGGGTGWATLAAAGRATRRETKPRTSTTGWIRPAPPVAASRAFPTPIG